MKFSQSIPILCLLFITTFISAQKLTVMTYNIRLDVASDGENDWSHRKDFFCAQIQFYEPDIFGIQEAKPNQVIDISNSLISYAQIGQGRDGNNQGESSNIYFKKERFKLLESNTFWLSETPDIVSKGWDAAFNRVCTYGLFEDMQSNKKFWVFNTHLDHMGQMARTNGIDLILKTINQKNTAELPVIFMGDFNSEPTTERIITLRKAMNDTRLVSRQKPFGPSGTFNNFKHDQAVTNLIDYVFVSKKPTIQVNKYAILSDSRDLKYPSDHLPVFVELKMD
ncbi:endonuclease/exonuclease/phosphatase family protein [Flavobacterium sp. CYK-55]|uniref:endonuclease/exonuclease/phosphatase family protein n=1 Tax=Flavobacterium sp. CYK-55 TaxID=2835529 RepID=UPI001BCAB8EB|nr:endonuclease/exonuclease/phosphatase family protein [Flavobacterium sp. CYK-55]MBS7788024.1 endonuclease/exonuclease/phosphatase family protein [Flavobacterium sp. CYK-55]